MSEEARNTDDIPWLVRLVWGNGNAEELRRAKSKGKGRVKEDPPKSKSARDASSPANTKAKRTEKSDGKGEEKAKKGKERKLEEAKKGEGEDNNPMDPEKFTKSQDQQLEKLKSGTPGRAWKDLCKDMGIDEKFAGALKARYKALRDAVKAEETLEAEKKESVEESKDESKTDAEKESKKKSESEPQSKIGKAKKNSGSKEKKSEEKTDVHGLIELNSDNIFSEEELEILASIWQKDLENRWLRMASKFYDMTGRRVHEDCIRDIFMRC